MPNCFHLCPKSPTTGISSTMPDRLNHVDERICEALSIPCHPTRYAFGWYDVIGWGIAVCGHPLGSQALRDYVASMPEAKEELLEILTWLEANYSSDAWATIGKSR